MVRLILPISAVRHSRMAPKSMRIYFGSRYGVTCPSLSVRTPERLMSSLRFPPYPAGSLSKAFDALGTEEPIELNIRSLVIAVARHSTTAVALCASSLGGKYAADCDDKAVR